jgi:hypothetical protein
VDEECEPLKSILKEALRVKINPRAKLSDSEHRQKDARMNQMVKDLSPNTVQTILNSNTQCSLLQTILKESKSQ